MYSQSEEEKYILEYAPAEGLLLDIGAYDGLTFSNSMALIESGWSAVLVEPAVLPFQALLERYNQNDNVTLVHCLTGVQRSLVPFWNSNGDGVSTTELGHYEKWNTAAKFNRGCFMPRLTVDDLIDHFPELLKCQFVSIDTEGTSAYLFTEFPFRRLSPKVFCVEYDQYGEEVIKFGNARGYDVKYQSDENLVLVKRD